VNWYGPSFTSNTSFIGERVNGKKPYISFAGPVTTGLSLVELSMLLFRNQFHNSANLPTLLPKTFMSYVSCDVYFSSTVFVNSPLRQVAVFYASFARPGQIFTAIFSLSENATWISTTNSSVFFLVGTRFYGDATFPIVLNEGLWTLAGWTHSNLNPEVLSGDHGIQALGSTTSPVSIESSIHFQQVNSGMFYIYLNYTMQLSPVLYLPTNETVFGQLIATFFLTSVESNNPPLYYGPLYYGTSSSFSAIAYRTIKSANVSRSLAMSSVNGLWFSMRIITRPVVLTQIMCCN
jgi:hypothetical protein